MVALTFGTFIRLDVPHEETRSSIEAAISVPEGFWAFKYDTIKSLVYVTWNPGQPEVSEYAETSNYRLRLWSGSNPQQMALTGFEEIVKFNIDNLPWEHPIPKITLDVCFWFGIEKIRDQELERTTRLYTEIEAECAKWRPTIKKFQRANGALKTLDQKATAEGRGTEWVRRGLKDLQRGVKKLRRIVSVSDTEDSKAQTNNTEELALQNEKIIAEKEELQDQITILEKEAASKDVDITELSETVYRLQCENDVLKGESDEDGLIGVTKPRTERRTRPERTKTDQIPKNSDNSRQGRVLAPRGVRNQYTKAIALPYRASNSNYSYRRHAQGYPKLSPAPNAGITTAVHGEWTVVDGPPEASKGRSVGGRGGTKHTQVPDIFEDTSTRLFRQYPGGVPPKRERHFY